MDDTDDTIYPAVFQKCSNEFMVIDVNEDSNVKDYFTSFQNWHYALGGPVQMDYSNWEQWWLPNAQFSDTESANENDGEYFQYAISEDCSTCSLDNNKDSDYTVLNEDYYADADRTAYYMTG